MGIRIEICLFSSVILDLIGHFPNSIDYSSALTKVWLLPLPHTSSSYHWNKPQPSLLKLGHAWNRLPKFSTVQDVANGDCPPHRQLEAVLLTNQLRFYAEDPVFHLHWEAILVKQSRLKTINWFKQLLYNAR